MARLLAAVREVDPELADMAFDRDLKPRVGQSLQEQVCFSYRVATLQALVDRDLAIEATARIHRLSADDVRKITSGKDRAWKHVKADWDAGRFTFGEKLARLKKLGFVPDKMSAIPDKMSADFRD